MRILILVLTVILPTALSAQGRWTLTLESGLTTYSSAAHDTASPSTHLRPWRPVLYSLRLSHDRDRLGFGVALGAAHGRLGIDVEEFALQPGETIDLVEFAPEISYRLGETSRGAVLRAHAGPVLDVWMPSGEDPRYRFGGQVGVTLRLALTARWAVTLRGDVAVTPSFLDEGDETPDLRRDGTMRRGRLGIGIARRL
jgi:hypothetical protein